MSNFVKQHSKILLRNANVITMDPLRRRVQSVAIQGGTIGFIGSDNLREQHTLKDYETIDCKGRTVVPGFIDAHCHLRAFAESLVTLSLRPADGISSIADIQSSVRRLTRNLMPGTWIRGRGYHDFYLLEKRHPTRWDLDEAAPIHPVKLTHRSGHAHVLNSLAMQLAGISIETPDPAGGIIDRDKHTGEPTGVLYEMSRFLSGRIPPPDSKSFAAGVKLAEEQFLQMGITSVQDASYLNRLDQWREFRTWKKEALFRPNIQMMLGAEIVKEGPDKGCDTGLGRGDGPRITGVKIILDETAGELYPAQAELDEIILRAHSQGLQVAIHAVEKNAVESACCAIEAALREFPRIDHRHRIEHCSLCDPILSRRLGSLGVMVVTQPAFIYHHGDRYLQTVPEEEIGDLYPLKTLLEGGVGLAASSDSPMDPPNPFLGIYSAVTRRSKSGRAVSPEQAVAPWSALRMYTCDAAKAMFQEATRGTIEPGKAADLAVLSHDPTAVSYEDLTKVKVHMTMINGEVVWKNEF